jgi:4-alpha-glucanotransferase
VALRSRRGCTLVGDGAVQDDGQNDQAAGPHTRPRAAGILLHPTSLPGPHGCGDIGPSAYRFVDWLAAARQKLWQVLPLSPTGFGNSPYAAASAFAGNPLLISIEALRDDGLLSDDDISAVPSFPHEQVSFVESSVWKNDLLRRAYGRLLTPGCAAHTEPFERFRAEQAGWLDDYALFMALREAHDGRVWTAWGAAIRAREPAAMADARRDLADEIAFQQFAQYLFDKQWGALRGYCAERDVRILGDIPIFVAHDSADVWANQRLFALDAAGEPEVVAGVPPDYFSATGQRWGNPLYRWDVLAAEGYRWWIERFRATLRQVDLVRIDHFRGFESYWEIPATHPTAEQGRWATGPGIALFEALRAALGEAVVVAEDLGTITPAVDALRRASGAPGMRVLQFAFGDDARNPYLPHNYAPDTVVYTGTHDNDTTAGWYATLDERARYNLLTYLARNGEDIVHDLIRLAYMSVADTAIVPMQDVLGLGNEARMNLPGRPEANWSWRLPPDGLHEADAAWLAGLVETYGR